MLQAGKVTEDVPAKSDYKKLEIRENERKAEKAKEKMNERKYALKDGGRRYRVERNGKEL